MSLVKLGKFAVSGVVATLVHGAGMYLYAALGLGPHLAFFLGFVGAVVVRYFVDTSFVFRPKASGPVQFGRYVVACVLSYAVSATLFATAIDMLALNTAVAFVLSVALTTTAGYLLTGYALKDPRPSP